MHIGVDHNKFPRHYGIVRSGTRVQVGRTLAAFALVAFLGGLRPAEAQSPARTTPGGAQSPPVDTSAWMDGFLKLLRHLYELLGGDPADLSNDPVAAMSAITAWFQQHGLPPGTGAQTHDGLQTIASLDEYLQSPPSSINPEDFAGLEDIKAAFNAQ